MMMMLFDVDKKDSLSEPELQALFFYLFQPTTVLYLFSASVQHSIEDSEVIAAG